MKDKKIIDMGHYKQNRVLKEFKKEYPQIKSIVLEIVCGDIDILFKNIEKALEANNAVAIRFLIADLLDLYDDVIGTIISENVSFNEIKHNENETMLIYYRDWIDSVL
ncbi:MAG: hypothetical protein KAQ68_06480 [Clostridiales bacterium]|nr:hypothetical protein [Clostridiales bacterium]